MNIAIHYFSGCGNTAWVVSRAVQMLQSLGHTVVLVQDIEQALPTSMPISDVDFFMSPTFFFGLPTNFVAYLKRLPMVAGRKAVFWSVNAGVAGASCLMAGGLLKDRGYDVIATGTVQMPDTFLFLKASQMSAQERQDVLKNALTQIKDNLTVLDNPPPLENKSILKTFLYGVVYMLYYVVVRHTIGLSFVSSSKCIHCGLCAQNCPVKAIRFDGQKPHWNTGCVGCFRCVNACPACAIDYSMYAVLFGAAGAIAGAMIFCDIFPFLGFISKLAGLLGGWFAGCFVFQRVSSMFSTDKMLCLVDKKRVLLTDDEKEYNVTNIKENEERK